MTYMRKFSENSRCYQTLNKLHKDGKITTLSKEESDVIDSVIDDICNIIKIDARNLNRKSEAIVRQQNHTMRELVNIEKTPQ